MELLIERGSIINSIGGIKPLTWAFLTCNLQSMKCLMRHGERLDKNLVMRTQMKSEDFDEDEKICGFLIEYADIAEILLGDPLRKDLKMKLWTLLLQHIAKLQALGLPVNQKVLETIFNREDYKDYFEGCKKELEVVKSTKPEDYWITYFNLLVDGKRKLKNYAGNRNLAKCVQKSDFLSEFPIYGASMQKKVEKGLKTSKGFDESAGVFSNILPVFGPSHLVVRDTLDCLTSKDYVKLTSKALL